MNKNLIKPLNLFNYLKNNVNDKRTVMTVTTQKVTIPCTKLNNGHTMPMVAFGTDHTSSDQSQLSTALKFALKIGYRHIDSASVSCVDPVLKQVPKQVMSESLGSLIRDDFFIGYKLWNTSHAHKSVQKSFHTTLNNLDLDYIDCFYIHSPMGFKENSELLPRDRQSGDLLYSDVHFLETYKSMEDLYNQGHIKSIGLCNFNKSQIEEILNNCKVKPSLVQIEVNPYFQNDDLVEFCQSNEMTVIAKFPFSGHKEDLFKNETLIRLADKYRRTVAQLCLRWLYQRGMFSVIQTLDTDQIEEYALFFNFDISNEDMSLIKMLDKNYRFHTLSYARNHKFYPFKEGE